MSNSQLSTFLNAIKTALEDTSFVRLTLAGYKGPDKSLKRIIATRATIKGQDHLSFTYRHQTRDITKNAPLQSALDIIQDALSTGFNASTLFTTNFDYSFPHLKKSQPLYKIAPNPTHNRKKNYLIPQNAPYLHALGLSSAQGNIHAKSQDKFRQINKFIEILSPLITPISNPHIVDMGAGKGYLTFALYDHLNQTGKAPHIRAIEYRQDLVTLCNDIAFTCDFDNLKFEQGTIEHANMQNANIVIALHACDTATDDALAKAITAQAQLIVVSPCCHKQIRRDMGTIAQNHPLHPIMQHGIFMERKCEMITDTIRGLILESYGYKVKIFEFISDAHTAKNTMITATLAGKPKPDALKRAKQLMEFYQIPQQYLLKTLNI